MTSTSLCPSDTHTHTLAHTHTHRQIYAYHLRDHNTVAKVSRNVALWARERNLVDPRIQVLQLCLVHVHRALCVSVLFVCVCVCVCV